MIRRIGIVLSATLFMAGCATQPPYAHTRPMVTGAQLFSDTEACQQLARTGGVGSNGVPYNPALPSQAGAAFGAGLAEGFAQAQAQRTGYERCMADRGYLQTRLTPEELSVFRALKTEDARKAWLAEFAPRDHGARSIRLPEVQCKPNLLVACNTPN